MKVFIVTHDLTPANAHLMPWRTVCEVVEQGRQMGYDIGLVSLGARMEEVAGHGIPEGTVSVPKARDELECQLRKLIPDQKERVVVIWPLVWREPGWRTRVAGRLGVSLLGYFPGGVYRLRDTVYAIRRIGLRKSAPYLAEAIWPKAWQIRRWQSNGFTGMIALTQLTADTAVSSGWPADRIRAIPPGRDSHELSVDRKELSEGFVTWRRGRPFYVFAGPPSGIRGVYELLKAFELMADSHSDVCLVCLFRSDGPLEAGQISAVIAGMKHHDRVFCVWESLGKEQLESFMAECRAIVLPFIAVPSEIPLAMIEAMQFGKPVVTTNTGGSGDFVSDSGEAVTLGDVTGLSRTMSRLLVDTDYYRRKCIKTQDVYENHPTWNEMAVQWLECISDLSQFPRSGEDGK